MKYEEKIIEVPMDFFCETYQDADKKSYTFLVKPSVHCPNCMKALTIKQREDKYGVLNITLCSCYK